MDLFSLEDTLNAQTNVRLCSAYLYFSMSVDAERKGFNGVANWFSAQCSKEMRDVRRLMNHINAIGAKVSLYKIDEVPSQWNSLLSMLDDKLRRDEKIFELLAYALMVAVETVKDDSVGFIKVLQCEQSKKIKITKQLIECLKEAEDDRLVQRLIDEQLNEKGEKCDN